MRYDTFSAVVVVFAVFGLPLSNEFHRRRFNERMVGFLLATGAYSLLTGLLLYTSDYYDPWTVIPPYTVVLVQTNLWFKLPNYRRMVDAVLVVAAFGLWGAIAFTDTLPYRYIMLACIAIVHMHVFFYELWVVEIYSKYDH